MEVLKGSPAEPPRRQPGFFDLVVNRLQAVGISLIAGLLLSAAFVIVFGLLAREVFLSRSLSFTFSSERPSMRVSPSA